MYVTVDLGDAKNDAVKYRVYSGHLFYMRGQYQLKWTVNECLKFKEVKLFRLSNLQIITFLFVFCFFLILALTHMHKSNYEKAMLNIRSIIRSSSKNKTSNVLFHFNNRYVLCCTNILGHTWRWAVKFRQLMDCCNTSPYSLA